MPAGGRRPAPGHAGHWSRGLTRAAGTWSDLVCLLTVLVAAVAASVDPDPSLQVGEQPAQRLPPSPPVCPQCLALSDREEATNLKFEAIKRQILAKLNLVAKPNITAPLPPKEAILEALKKSPYGTDDGQSSYEDRTHPYYDQQGNARFNSFRHYDYIRDDMNWEEKDDFYGKTSEIIAFAEPGDTLNDYPLIDLHHPHDNPQRLRVKKATLWVHLRHDRSVDASVYERLQREPAKLYVFRVSATNNSSVAVNVGQFNGSSIGWKEVDMREVVEQWFKGSPQSKLTLLIDCGDCKGIQVSLFGNSRYHPERVRVRHGKRSQNAVDFRPFLVMATEPVERRRARRHTITCNSRSTRCCKQSLYVSFKELQWDDWIIAPKGYLANYCMGDCVSAPITPDLLGTFHTHVIEEYRNRNPYASIVPCCAPTRLSSMSLIYYDKNLNIIKTDLPKMVVEECGCT